MISGIAAFAFAGLYYYTENQNYIHYSALFLGFSLVMLAQSGLHTGKLRMRRTYAIRDERPVIYWLLFGLYLIGGCSSFGAGLWQIFIKS